jgi:hypothetical protein
MNKHPELKSIIRKICSKCNIYKSINSFSNDKYKKDGKRSQCIECQKVSKEMFYSSVSGSLSPKAPGDECRESPFETKDIDSNHSECTICNKIISKTNWSKHVKTKIQREKS